MKCPTCQTNDTSVTETRSKQPGIVQRGHLCGNGHRFRTLQLYEAAARSIGMTNILGATQTTLRGAARRADAFMLRRTITRLLAAGKTPSAIAPELGITAARVRRLRRAIQAATKI